MGRADLIALHIDSALHDLEFLVDFEVHSIPLLKFRLKHLKKLVLICERKEACDAGLGSLLVRIEDVVCRVAKQIHDSLQLIGETHPPHLDKRKRKQSPPLHVEFQEEIRSLKESFDEWYCSRKSSANSTRDGVLKFISYISEALVDVQNSGGMPEWFWEHWYPNRAIEALEGQFSFMKTLISFVTITTLNVEADAIHDLLASAESITIFIAYHLITSVSEVDLNSLIQVCLQEKLEPVYETYSRALRWLISHRSLIQLVRDDDALVAMRDFVDSLLCNLWDLSIYGTWLPLSKKFLSLQTLDAYKQDLQELYGGLESLRTALKKQQQLSMRMKEDIGLAVCDAGVFICSLHPTLEVDVGLLKNLLDAIICILTDVAANDPNVPVLNAAGEVGLKRMPSLGASSSTNEVVGFNEDEEAIVNQLTGGLDRLQIIAIVGMPGLGKTTLATKVYNNPSISFHFHVRAWCHASQTVDRKKVLLDLLNQIDPSKCSKRSTEHELADTLRKSLLGRRYIIFLDDVWDIGAWNVLSESFPKDSPDNRRSRIILTSRRHDVAPIDMLVDKKPYYLRQFNDKESLELLYRECSSGLSLDLGMKIAEKCKGLPLMIVIVAGVLKHTESEGWDELLNCLSSASIMEQCRNTLELSYMQLPDYLKPCLLYFGTFLENQEVSVRRLLRLWIAEGFVLGDDINSPDNYLNDLIGRSLIMVAKQRSLGGVKTCRIHDLIRDFCVQKAKDENLFHLVRGYDELSTFKEPRDLQRLCIHSKAEHFNKSKLFCPFASSLILNFAESTQTSMTGIERHSLSQVFRIFKCLKVLDLEQVHFGYRFPREIEQFVHLSFLAILCEAEIPWWIGNLSCLETLIKLGDTDGHLPGSLWNLRKLQYLYLGGGNAYYSFNQIFFGNSLFLHELDSISGVVIPYYGRDVLLRRFRNIRKLKGRLLYYMYDGNNLLFSNILGQIQSLSLLYIYDDEKDYRITERMKTLSMKNPTIGIRELSLPATLKKLTLGGFSLSSENMSTIGVLPSLEVLKLLRIKFEGRTWSMREREFLKLKILKLVDLDLVCWCSDKDDDLLESLEKLVFENIGSSLREIPSCLETIVPLAVIEVSDCYYTVLDLVEHIERRREEMMGDSGVKIIRNNIKVRD